MSGIVKICFVLLSLLILQGCGETLGNISPYRDKVDKLVKNHATLRELETNLGKSLAVWTKKDIGKLQNSSDENADYPEIVKGLEKHDKAVKFPSPKGVDTYIFLDKNNHAQDYHLSVWNEFYYVSIIIAAAAIIALFGIAIYVFKSHRKKLESFFKM